MVTAYLSLTAATARGHLDQQKQGQDTTASEELDEDDSTTGSKPKQLRTAYTKVILLSHIAHSDLTGCFPIKAPSEAEFIFISVLDGCIHCEPMTSRHQTSYIRPYKSTLLFWEALRHKTMYQRLDNETSSALEQYASKNNLSKQNVLYEHSRITSFPHCAPFHRTFILICGTNSYHRQSFASAI